MAFLFGDDVLRAELKLRNPENVSIVGNDNAPETAWGVCNSSKVTQDSVNMIDATVSI